MSDGRQVAKLLSEGMQIDSLEAVVDRSVINCSVVQQLLSRPLRVLALDGTSVSRTFLRSLASSSWIAQLTELHLGQHCLHPQLRWTGQGTDDLCAILRASVQLVRLTLPPFVDFAAVRDSVPDQLRSLSIRTSWAGCASEGEGIHVFALKRVCFTGLRELELGMLTLPSPTKPMPELDVCMPQMEELKILGFRSQDRQPVRRRRAKDVLFQLLTRAPKLRTLIVPSGAVSESLRQELQAMRACHFHEVA